MAVILDGPRWGPASGGAPRHLVFLLHGVGADGFDLIDLAPGWGKAVPDALFIAPHGPEPCDLAPYGRQWFSLQDRSEAMMQAGAESAASGLAAYSGDRGQQFQAIVGTNSTGSWAGFMPIGLWIRKAGWRQAFRLTRSAWRQCDACFLP